MPVMTQNHHHPGGRRQEQPGGERTAAHQGMIPKSIGEAGDACRIGQDHADKRVRPVLDQSLDQAPCRRRRRQQIAEPAHGLDDVDVELLADAADEHLDGVGVAVEILVVEMLDQFGARHHAPGVVHEIGQQPVFVRGHLDRVAGHADPAGAGVQRHRPAGQFGLGMAGGAAQQRADPRQDFLEVKRLGDVVVGAGIEALHLVAPAVARGQDQDRHRAAVAAPGLQHRDAVHLGQADVEHDGVIGLAVAEEVPLLAVEGAIDHIAGIRQRRGQLTIEIRIILNDKQAQAGLRW